MTTARLARSYALRLLIARLLAASVGIAGGLGFIFGLNPYIALMLCLGCVVFVVSIEKSRPEGADPGGR